MAVLLCADPAASIHIPSHARSSRHDVLAAAEVCASFGPEYALKPTSADWGKVEASTFRALFDETAEDLAMLLREEVPQ